MVGGAGGKQGNAEPGDVLREGKDDREQSMQNSEGCPGCRRNSYTHPQARPVVHGQPTRERAGHHDAFDAEVEYAGTFTQQHPQGAKDQRSCDAQHSDPERGRCDDVPELDHEKRTL